MGTGNAIDVSVYQKAKKGNYYCGDSYFFKETENEFICALADGLGSGEFARESSDAVIQLIEQNYDTSVDQLIKQCQKVLVGKRGVVLGVLKVNFKTNSYTFSSIGNISMMTISADYEKKRNIPNTGYLGGYERPIKVTKGKLMDGMIFILFSDGVSSRELASKYFLGKDVRRITETFSNTIEPVRKDDTTLIAMKYL